MSGFCKLFLKNELELYLVKEITDIIIDYVGQLLQFSVSPEQLNEVIFIRNLIEKGKAEYKYTRNIKRFGPIFDQIRENYPKGGYSILWRNRQYFKY
jgi:hypothetical protein